MKKENSLMQSRTREIREAVRDLDSKLEKGDLADEVKEKAHLDTFINVVLSVKKIKKDLHQQ